jgi:glutamyl-tRNA reductase
VKALVLSRVVAVHICVCSRRQQTTTSPRSGMMTAMAGTKVAVIGAGNVGCALDAHLTLRSIDVRLCNRSAARLEEIRRSGGITVTGVVEGVAPIPTLTTDVGEAGLDPV